jgi:hypothetical protein
MSTTRSIESGASQGDVPRAMNRRLDLVLGVVRERGEIAGSEPIDASAGGELPIQCGWPPLS